jgi:hypothetical protein
MQTPTLDPTTQETPEQRAFAEIAARVTAANIALEEAKQARDLFRFNNKIPSPEVREHFAKLQGDVVQKERALQQLLAPYAEAKGRLSGWS